MKQLIARRTLIKVAGQTLCGAIASGSMLSIGRAADDIKIGFLGPLSGALALVGQTNLNCMLVAAQEINAAGGINGRRVQVIVEDSQMSTKVTLEKARKLFISDQVIALTGMVLPSEREAALSAAALAKGYVVFPNFGDGKCHPNLLTTGLSPDQTTGPVVEWLTKNVGKTAYLIFSDVSATRNVLAPMLKTEFEARGGRLVGTTYFPFGTRDYGPELQNIAAAKPDIVFHLIADDPNTFVKQFASFGAKSQLVSPLIHEAGAAATGDSLVGSFGYETYYMSVDTPANKAFLKNFNTTYPDFTPRRTRGLVTMQPHGERSYVAVKMLAEAVRLGGTKLDGLKAGLAKVVLEAPRGIVRVDSTGGHLVTDTLIGRVAADKGIDVVSRLGSFPAKCLST